MKSSGMSTLEYGLLSAIFSGALWAALRYLRKLAEIEAGRVWFDRGPWP